MPIIIDMLLMLLMLLVLLRAPLALLAVETIITPVGLLMISAISPILCGPIVSAIIISSIIGVLGRWVRESLCRWRVGTITTRSVRPPSLVVRGIPLKPILILIGVVMRLVGILLRVGGIIGIGALPGVPLITLLLVLPLITPLLVLSA